MTRESIINLLSAAAFILSAVVWYAAISAGVVALLQAGVYILRAAR